MDKYYSSDAIDFVELSEDISQYQVSDKEKQEISQTGKDVFDEVAKMLRSGDWKLNNKDNFIFLPYINADFQGYDPVAKKDMMEYMETNPFEELNDIKGVVFTDPKTGLGTLVMLNIKEGRREPETYEEYLQQEREDNKETEEKRLAMEARYPEPKTYEEYLARDEKMHKDGVAHRIKTMFTELNTHKGRDSFQKRYFLTDEFAKTDKYKELRSEYVAELKNKDDKIRAEVSHMNFAFQENYLMEEKAAESLKDSLLVGKSKEDWLEFYSGHRDNLKIMLENAKDKQNSEHPEPVKRATQVIEDIEKSIKFFDTIANTLKDKWKYGSFDVAS
jgi:hypothetical protein